MDRFTDAVNARVLIPDARRLLGGVGLVGERVREWDDGVLTLRGSLDLESMFSGARTIVQVSGEPLMSEAVPAALLVGLSGTYRQGAFTFSAGLALVPHTLEATGFLHIGARF